MVLEPFAGLAELSLYTKCNIQGLAIAEKALILIVMMNQ